MMDILQVSPQQLFAILIAGCLEGFGIPWPGALVVAAAGVATGGDWLAISTLACLFGVSYCLGAIGQYTVGRLLGTAALAWMPQAQQAKLTAMTDKYGKAVVLWTRPLAIGNYVSIPAGIMRMNLRQFSLFTFLGIAPWAFGILHLGGYLGDQVGSLQSILAQWTLPLVALIGAAALLTAAWKLLRSRESTANKPLRMRFPLARRPEAKKSLQHHACQIAARRTVTTLIERGLRPPHPIPEAAAST